MDSVPYTPGAKSRKPDAQVHPEERGRGFEVSRIFSSAS